MLVKITTIAAAGAVLWGNPAMAEEAAVGGVIDTSAVTNANTGDDAEFRELFASWEDLENGGRVTAGGDIAPAPRSAVAVPSRMPVEAVAMTSNYGMRNHPILRRRAQHNGVDLAAPSGTPVYATADGVVARAERFSSYGNYIQIEHGGQMHTRYAHLSGYAVAAGDSVVKGQLIGFVGSTGRSTGPHLHYEVRVDGEPVDPRPYMYAQYAELEQGDGGQGGPD